MLAKVEVHYTTKDRIIHKEILEFGHYPLWRELSDYVQYHFKGTLNSFNTYVEVKNEHS